MKEPRRPIRRPMSAEKASSPKPGLFLLALGTYVPDTAVLDDRVLLTLLVDDCCWRIAKEDWLNHRPQRWQHREVAGWIDERAALAQEAQRIRTLAQYRC
jgi:hypothetical protein